MIKHKGYQAHVEFDDENEIFHGEIIGIQDVITFQGKSVAALKKAMKDSLDDYLDWCKERGKAPNKPYSGSFVLRLEPRLHRKIAIAARRSKKSMNSWVANVLAEKV